MNKAKVYFTSKIETESLIKLYKKVNRKLEGKVAVKIHSGEPDGNNYLKPEFMKDIVKYLNGTIVECNTAYKGRRFKTEDHMKVLEEHGFTKIAPVDILDGEGTIKLPIDGKYLKYNIVGSHLNNYDSILMLSHFKGHPMGGFGGALKNMSIGLASSGGKALIHTAGKTDDTDIVWKNTPKVELFMESMAEADKTIMDKFKDKIVYINAVVNLSVDCDCVSHPEDPCMEDIGILASLDPVALDKACLDLIYNSNDKGRDHFIERVETRKGPLILDYAEKLGLGTKEYDLINID